ncbi:hypothetical protein [Shigella dysenteriae]|uniref:hypothetical protein n=1 Tax=Shigella dysenteriae TaxID=622 RepID=UPI003AFB0765
MNGDNPSPNRPLVTVVYKGLIFMTAKKTASKPAVNACMDRFVFCFYANRHFPALITDR